MSNKGLSAFDLVNKFSEKEISNILYKYGEEKFSRSIAKKIIEKRKLKSIKTTNELVLIIKSTINAFTKKDLRNIRQPKTFQALRIFC